MKTFKPFGYESIFGIRVFYATVIWSAVWAFFIMVLVNQIGTLGKVLYTWTSKTMPYFLQKIKPSDWVSRAKLSKLEQEHSQLSQDFVGRSNDLSRLQSENDKIKQELKTEKTSKDNLVRQVEEERTKFDSKLNELNISNVDRTALNDENKLLQDQVKTLMIPRTERVVQLENLLLKSAFAPQAEQQWIYNATCLVHDYQFKNGKRIAIDTYCNEQDWEIQVFTRDGTEVEFLSDLIKNENLLGSPIENFETKGVRIIYKKLSAITKVSAIA